MSRRRRFHLNFLSVAIALIATNTYGSSDNAAMAKIVRLALVIIIVIEILRVLGKSPDYPFSSSSHLQNSDNSNKLKEKIYVGRHTLLHLLCLNKMGREKLVYETLIRRDIFVIPIIIVYLFGNKIQYIF